MGSYHIIVILVVLVVFFLLRRDVALAQVGHEEVDVTERLLADGALLHVRVDPLSHLNKLKSPCLSHFLIQVKL